MNSRQERLASLRIRSDKLTFWILSPLPLFCLVVSFMLLVGHCSPYAKTGTKCPRMTQKGYSALFATGWGLPSYHTCICYSFFQGSRTCGKSWVHRLQGERLIDKEQNPFASLAYERYLLHCISLKWDTAADSDTRSCCILIENLIWIWSLNFQKCTYLYIFS